MGKSSIWDRQVDSALRQDANYRFNSADRSYIDSQARGLQQHVVQSLIGGTHCTWMILDNASADGVAGDVVCMAASAAGTVTRAVAAAISNAGGMMGVLMQAAGPGGAALIAIGGVVPPSITGLTGGANRFARLNSSTARVQSVASLSAGDVAIGTVDAAGNLTVQPGVGASGNGPQPTYFASLNSLTPSASRQSVFVDGHDVVGDGGQGTFFWVAPGGPQGTKTAGTTDGGTWYAPAGGAGGWWQRKYSGPLLAPWFGAKGDGVTDDRAAIQAMADSQVSGRDDGCRLPVTATKVNTDGGTLISSYVSSAPIFINNNTNQCHELSGDGMTAVEICGKFVSGVPPLYPSVVVGSTDNPTNAVTFTTDNTYATPVRCLNSLNDVNGRPETYINLSTYDTGKLKGLTAFCFEIFVNPLSEAVMSGNRWFGGCGGNEAGVNNTTFKVERYSVGGPLQIQAVLEIGGALKVANSTVDLTLNYLNHVAVDYDGAHLRLFINGVKQAETAATGTVGTLQKLFEEFVIMGGAEFAEFPSVAGFVAGLQTGHWGLCRVSDISRYTANFTANPANVVADNNSIAHIDFATSKMGDTVHPAGKAWVIAKAMREDRLLVDAWYFLNPGIALTFATLTRIHDLRLSNNGWGVYLYTAQNTTVENVFFVRLRSGVIADAFSYVLDIGRGCKWFGCGTYTARATGGVVGGWFADIALLYGTQFAKIGGGHSTEFGSANWHLLAGGAYDVKVNPGWINGPTVAPFYISSCNSVTIEASVSDETHPYTSAAAVVINSNVFRWRHGYISQVDSTGVPLVRVHQSAPCVFEFTIPVGVLSNPVATFSGTAYSQLELGCTPMAGSTAMIWTDGTAVPFFVTYQEKAGKGAISMTADSNRAVTVNEAAFGYIEVTSTLPLTSTRTLTQAANNPLKRTKVRNSTTGGQSISWNGVAIANGACVEILDNGTTWEVVQ